MQMTGRVALITGGTHGIGKASALKLAGQGMDIGIAARNVSGEVRSVAQRIEESGRRCVLIRADLERPEEARTCVSETMERLGRLDVLLHSAGGRADGSLLEVSDEVWYRAFDLHLHAAFHLSRAAVPHMMQLDDAAIVLVSSVAGIRGCANALPYGVVKGAVCQLVRSLARELADYRIRVNCVAPGLIMTRFQETLTDVQLQNAVSKRIPLHRTGTAEDVADAIAFLVKNTYITGETLVVDGGLTMRIA